MALVKVSVATFVALASVQLVAEAADKVRGCYYTNWAQYRTGRAKFTPEDYEPCLCTHIFYSFAGVNEGDFSSKATDPTDLGDSGGYKKINDLKKKDPGLKTILSWGGANFPKTTWKSLSSSKENRKKYIDSAIKFAKDNGFDGIDIDWEFPDASDKENFAALLKELKAAAGDLEITAAVSQNPEVIKAGYDKSIGDNVDFLNVMAYDYHGSWEQKTGANAPLYDDGPLSVDGSMKAWEELGIPKDKLCVGLASYGRGWTANGGMGAAASGVSQPTEFIKEGGVIAYYEICEKIAKGAKRTFDDKTKTPYIQDGNEWFTYDDKESIKEKSKYIKDKGYRGGFFWTLDEDDFNGKCPDSKGEKYPLINSMNDVLGKSCDGAKKSSSASSSATEATPKSSPASGSTPTGGSSPAGGSSPKGSSPGGQATTSKSGGCEKDGFFSDPAKPNGFIRCAGGQKYNFDCAPGLKFSEQKSACAWA